MRALAIILVVLVTGSLSLTYKRAAPILNYKDPKNARELYEQFKRDYNRTVGNDGEEFKSMYANAEIDAEAPTSEECIKSDLTNVPRGFDWRDEDVVGPVEDQGRCGSCWAFSVVGNIEGLLAIRSGRFVRFSKQQLLDCDELDAGCNGGLPLQAYKEIIRMGGIELETTYPYEGRERRCRLNTGAISGHIYDSKQLCEDETEQAAYLAKNGPLSVAVNADMLQFYRHGISHPWSLFCSPRGLNHAVLSVGFGEESGEPYWIVKNSWGSKWGENVSFYVNYASYQSICLPGIRIE